jgi:hypothetical protein
MNWVFYSGSARFKYADTGTIAKASIPGYEVANIAGSAM